MTKKSVSVNAKSNPLSPETEAHMAFGTKNYITIIASVVILIIGFILLSGGGSENPATEFNMEMFSTRRIVVAPLVLLLGFATAGFGVMYRFKK